MCLILLSAVSKAPSLERDAGRRRLRGRCDEPKRRAPSRNPTACIGASNLSCFGPWKHRSPKSVLVPSYSGSRPQIAHRLLHARSLDVGHLFNLCRLNLTPSLARLGITLSIWKPSMKKSGRNSILANTLARWAMTQSSSIGCHSCSSSLPLDR